jgi:hypothetical protein
MSARRIRPTGLRATDPVWATNTRRSRACSPTAARDRGCCLACCGFRSQFGSVVDDRRFRPLLRLDARTGARQAHVKLPFLAGDLNAAAGALAVGAGSVWVADQHGHDLANRCAKRRRDRDARGRRSSVIIAVGAGAVWVASADGMICASTRAGRRGSSGRPDVRQRD